MVKITLNLGDLIAAYFGVPGPSSIKNMGLSTTIGMFDKAMGAAEEAFEPTTVSQDLDKIFDEIRIFDKDPVSAAKLPSEFTQSLQPSLRGGSETLADIFATLRSMAP